ncbi:MAG TPA: diguanylate cyclase [Steroidobacteraceae bacterium]
MTAFLSSQLDFILFFYGLAFILLGATCWTVARSQGGGEAWAMLGGFGFAHGIGEWLDLTALIVGDTPAFAVTRVALMASSFFLLLDFARLKGIRQGLVLPGRWVYVPLALLVVLVGFATDVVGAGIAARYAIGLVSAVSASLVLARQARIMAGGAKAFLFSAAAGFGVYAVAAGIIVPAGPFWPSTIINHGAFFALTGMPIQLVRGLLAFWISLSIWASWGQRLASEVGSSRYTAFVRQHFIWTFVVMGATLVCGWALTEHLGGVYRDNVQREGRSDLDLLASGLAGETATVDGAVMALAESPSMLPLLTSGNRHDDEIGRSMLKLHIEAAGASSGYILDSSGAAVASSNPSDAGPGAPDYRSSPWFAKSMTGAPDYRFVFNRDRGAVAYQASRPIRADDGTIVGVAVLIKSLEKFAADVRHFDRPYFLIDPDGVVAMSNNPGAVHRTLWPLTEAKRTELSLRFGTLNGRPMLERDIIDATWTKVDGERNYVARRFADHSDWSLVVLKPTRELFATRFLGIVITLLVTIMALIYLLGRGRWVHDQIQLESRLKLQELAQSLGVKATTDPLTGLHNRLKLGSTLNDEILRVHRYKTPLSLVLFDIDNFKKVNDSYGHPIGDQVLIQLSRFVPNLIRSTDLLARWGGEEFLILAPGSDAAMAFQLAEKLRDAIASLEFPQVKSVTCSFGIAQYAPGETAAELIARADAALYRAKIEGRTRATLAPQPVLEAPGLASVA